MVWHVEGADSVTGFDTSRDIEAETQADAERIARTQFGILIATINPIDTLNELDALAAQPPRQRQQRAASANVESGPTYFGILVATFVLGVSSALCYIIGAIGIVAAIGMAKETVVPNGYDAMSGYQHHEEVVEALVMGLTSLVTGALLHGASTGLIALRDIAKNSFRRS